MKGKKPRKPRKPRGGDVTEHARDCAAEGDKACRPHEDADWETPPTWAVRQAWTSPDEPWCQVQSRAWDLVAFGWSEDRTLSHT
jgi:hypothetical protein